jgi:hypothetical protein
MRQEYHLSSACQTPIIDGQKNMFLAAEKVLA